MIVRLLDGTQEFVTCPEDCLRIIREKLSPDIASELETCIADLQEEAEMPCKDCDKVEELGEEARTHEQEAGRLRLTLDNIAGQLKAVEDCPPDDIRALLATVRELIERG